MRKPLATARNAFLKMLGALANTDAKTVGSLLKKKLDLLLSMGSTFIIEMQVIEALAGDGGMQMIQDAALAMLPSKAKPTSVTLETISARMSAMKNSSLYKYNGSKGQSSVDVTAANFEQMIQGREPRVESLKASLVFAAVLAALPLFCHRSVQNAGSVAKVTHYGEKALYITLKEAVAKDTAKTLCFGDLNDLHVYAWLLTAAQKATLEGLTKNILAGLTVKVVKKPMVESKAKILKGKTLDGAEDNVRSLFV